MMLPLTTKRIGDYGERLAAKELKKSGYRITARNYRTAHGEIDIIAENREFLVFVEVKARRDLEDRLENYGRPCEAVTAEKQRHIRSAASVFLQKHPTDKFIRFDVTEVYLGKPNRINRIEDAF